MGKFTDELNALKPLIALITQTPEPDEIILQLAKDSAKKHTNFYCEQFPNLNKDAINTYYYNHLSAVIIGAKFVLDSIKMQKDLEKGSKQ